MAVPEIVLASADCRLAIGSDARAGIVFVVLKCLSRSSGTARYSGVTNTTPEPSKMPQSAQKGPPYEQIPSATGYGDRRRFF
jgi:hypothetical protein